MQISEFIDTLGRPVAYYPALAEIIGVKECVFLCQMIYWRRTNECKKEIYKSREEWRKETGLSFDEQVTVRRSLERKGLLKERYARIEHKIYFSINDDVLNEVFRNGMSLRDGGVPPVPGQGKISSGKTKTPDEGNAYSAARGDSSPEGSACIGGKASPSSSILVHRVRSEITAKEEEKEKDSNSTCTIPAKPPKTKRRVSATGNPALAEPMLNAISEAMYFQPFDRATRRKLIKLVEECVITPEWAEAFGLCLRTYNEDRSRWKPLVPFIPYTPKKLVSSPEKANKAIVTITDRLWEDLCEAPQNYDPALEEALKSAMNATSAFEKATKKTSASIVSDARGTELPVPAIKIQTLGASVDHNIVTNPAVPMNQIKASLPTTL